jgi:hypothetical protein
MSESLLEQLIELQNKPFYNKWKNKSTKNKMTEQEKLDAKKFEELRNQVNIAALKLVAGDRVRFQFNNKWYTGQIVNNNRGNNKDTVDYLPPNCAALRVIPEKPEPDIILGFELEIISTDVPAIGYGDNNEEE